ncbi:ImpA family metalloprotease [Vibrio mediterranei]|uniref:ImpA family metalloprotease n=1 Tax=Vibrio mediterranei TaxID=689 RepID=UPI001EFD360B|nr:ImpA family metalloprotease [Vibrio mediterranei]MCG9628976.1 ImpA family metalloprotease [Vibrio mediterranei]
MDEYHQWGEQDKHGTIGTYFHYDNPYNNDEEVFELIALDDDGTYSYFPIDKNNNKYWRYISDVKDIQTGYESKSYTAPIEQNMNLTQQRATLKEVDLGHRLMALNSTIKLPQLTDGQTLSYNIKNLNTVSKTIDGIEAKSVGDTQITATDGNTHYTYYIQVVDEKNVEKAALDAVSLAIKNQKDTARKTRLKNVRNYLENVIAFGNSAVVATNPFELDTLLTEGSTNQANGYNDLYPRSTENYNSLSSVTNYKAGYEALSDNGIWNNKTYRYDYELGGQLHQSSLKGLKRSALPDYQQKLLLLADLWRSQVTYPVDRADHEALLKAIFADNIHYEASQSFIADNGYHTLTKVPHFEGAKTASIHLAQKTSKWMYSFDKKHSLGIYIPAGVMVKISRTDSNSAVRNIKMSLNPFTDNVWYLDVDKSSRHYYYRPNHVMTELGQLGAGQTLTISSPYGGILMVEGLTDDANKNVVTFRVDKTQSYPVLDLRWGKVLTDSTKQSFLTALNDDSTGYAEILTDSFEFHADRTRLLASLKDNNGEVQLDSMLDHILRDYISADGTEGMFINSMYNLPNKTVEIAKSLGWDALNPSIHSNGKVSHFNLESSTCGFMCSGNPVTSSGKNFDPLGWGESHEVGHNNQYPEFRLFVDGEDKSGESSNNIFPLNKYTMYAQKLGYQQGYLDSFEGRHQPKAEALYQWLQTGRYKEDNGTTHSTLWDTNKGNPYMQVFTRLAVFAEIAYVGKAELYKKDIELVNGWRIFSLGYIAAREIHALIKENDEAQWDIKRSRYGFDDFTLAEARTFFARLNKANGYAGQDFMALVFSKITGTNWTTFFDLYKLPLNSKVRSSLAQLYSDSVDVEIFYTEPAFGLFDPSKQYKLPIDKITSYRSVDKSAISTEDISSIGELAVDLANEFTVDKYYNAGKTNVGLDKAATKTEINESGFGFAVLPQFFKPGQNAFKALPNYGDMSKYESFGYPVEFGTLTKSGHTYPVWHVQQPENISPGYGFSQTLVGVFNQTGVYHVYKYLVGDSGHSKALSDIGSITVTADDVSNQKAKWLKNTNLDNDLTGRKPGIGSPTNVYYVMSK